MLTGFPLLAAFCCAIVLSGDGDGVLSSRDMKLLVAINFIGVFCVISAWRFLQVGKRWRKQEADAQALLTCVSVLYLCGEMLMGRAKALTVDRFNSILCQNLGDFASDSPEFPDTERRLEVLRHVSGVQQVLMKSSGRLLIDGSEGVPGLVRELESLLDGLLEQRWLNLLDVSSVTSAESVTQSSQGEIDRRDIWIVVGGSSVAAIGLGVAAGIGVPLAAAVPAALVFLLGPAALWGSKRLGVSPRHVLDSVRTPVMEANQGGTPQQPSTGTQSQGVSPGAGA
ncbi:hypothetical protein J8N05_04340 [Streptomyces sp. BH-SS-21]|uniref:Uncharacterized protein n=1 Tax=Streptomyces liliiviolaceus TaxID=2823109 RepID=A0A940XNQ2_9ACTN|nr:hypothetical protein [Streptomyces liliiviolaceus]MBQ0847456.1 hypothetical protein [Streptomyces liliiviolaceus]